VQNPIFEHLKHLSLGRKQSYRNLEMVPLRCQDAVELSYLVLDEAMEENLIRIEEVDEDGTVSQLKVINRADKPVLIIDGEELVGARQNRIVNTTLLIDAGAKIIIPVSCVEQGRWAYNTKAFHSQKRMMSSALRAHKSLGVQCALERSGTFQSDQNAIWNDIAEKAQRMEAESPSMAMAEIYEKQSPRLQDYSGRFRKLDQQVGAIFAIDGHVVGIECFGKSDTLAKNFKKIVESYALDAIDSGLATNTRRIRKRAAEKLLKGIPQCRTRNYPSVGMGTDIRIESGDLLGFALAVGNRVLHLSVFMKNGGTDTAKGRKSSLSRFSSRRQRRIE
jgi:hypothetical protein